MKNSQNELHISNEDEEKENQTQGISSSSALDFDCISMSMKEH